jgi:methyltransferase-like protein
LRNVSNDVVQAEQYMDFLRNRTFRHSLVVRRGVQHSRSLTPASLKGLWVATSMQVDGAPDGPELVFRGRTNESLTTNDTALITAVRTLRKTWPGSMLFEDLVRAVAGTLGATSEALGQSLGMALLRLYVSSRLIELHATPSAFTLVVGEHPVASPLARLQAIDSIDVTNLRHEPVRLGDAERVLLTQLDGTRSREQVMALANDESAGEAILDELARRALLVA